MLMRKEKKGISACSGIDSTSHLSRKQPFFTSMTLLTKSGESTARCSFVVSRPHAFALDRFHMGNETVLRASLVILRVDRSSPACGRDGTSFVPSWQVC